MTTARDFRKLDVAIVVLSAITYLVDVATGKFKEGFFKRLKFLGQVRTKSGTVS